MNQLTGDLQNFINFFGIDKNLIAAAADYSSTDQKAEIDHRGLILQLAEKERIDYLVRLAKGESNMSMVLNRKLREFSKKNLQDSNKNQPSILELIQESEGKEEVK